MDIYPSIYEENRKKETCRKFLELYLFEKPNNEIEWEHNKFTLVKAKKIKSEWQMELLGQTLDMPFVASKNLDFLAYFKVLSRGVIHQKGITITGYLLTTILKITPKDNV